MNIAFVSNVVYPFVKGGAEKRIYEIGRRLVERNHSVTIYTRHYWDGPEILNQEGMTLHAVAPERSLYTGERRSIGEAIEFAARLILPMLRSENHDVVDVSSFPYFPLFTAKLATLRDSGTFVTTWHEVWNRYWVEYMGPIGVGGMLVERTAAQLPQRPIAVSELTADRLAKLRIQKNRIEIIPNGIDANRITETSPATNAPEVVFVGRLVESKNVDRLLIAFDRVAANHNIRLAIIGSGPEEERLRVLAERLQSRDRIQFYGFLDSDQEIYAMMQGAEIFVSPSTREGFGITVLEAMAAGCIVIAARHPESAAGEIIDDGGFLVPASTDALTDQLDAVLGGERPERDPCTVAQRFDWEHIVDTVEQFYFNETSNK